MSDVAQRIKDIVAKTLKVDAARVTDDLVRDLLSDDYGVIVMCSSMGREVSLENPDRGHGAFTKALLEGLRGQADYNRDTRIQNSPSPLEGKSHQ